jgi:hypothetical protein
MQNFSFNFRCGVVYVLGAARDQLGLGERVEASHHAAEHLQLTPVNSSHAARLQFAVFCTECLPSRLGLGANVMKNWLPLELGPLFAMLSTPLLSCFSSGCTSSAKAEPHALFPPLPVAVGSPPCA